MKSPVNYRPEGFHTVTPHLVCAGAAEAIEYYKKAFGATELVRLPTPNGKLMHASVRIGDSPVMLVDESPDYGALGPKALKGTPVSVHLYVPNVDQVIDAAVKAGGKLRMPAQDMFWGDRYGQVEDPFGHLWSVATHIRDVDHADLPKLAQEACA